MPIVARNDNCNDKSNNSAYGDIHTIITNARAMPRVIMYGLTKYRAENAHNAIIPARNAVCEIPTIAINNTKATRHHYT